MCVQMYHETKCDHKFIYLFIIIIIIIIIIITEDLEFILKRPNKTYKEGGLTINFNKTEFIAINTDQELHINIEENVTIKEVQNLKYLGENLNKKGINSKDIVNKICKGNE